MCVGITVVVIVCGHITEFVSIYVHDTALTVRFICN